MLAFAYIHPGGHLQISVHLDESEPWLIRSDATAGTGAAGAATFA